MTDSSVATLPGRIGLKKNFAPGDDGGHVVDDLERRRLGREELVARVFVLATVLGD